MDNIFLNDLRINETDVDGALNRLSGDVEIYIMILTAFPQDGTMAELERSIKNEAWDEAFTAAHALKGLAGNLGFTMLFHSLGQLVIYIRTGKIKELEASFKTVKGYYDDIVRIINNHCK